MASNYIYDNVDPNANIIFGALVDDRLGDKVKITVLATGFDAVGKALPNSVASKAESKETAGYDDLAPPSFASSSASASPSAASRDRHGYQHPSPSPATSSASTSTSHREGSRSNANSGMHESGRDDESYSPRRDVERPPRVSTPSSSPPVREAPVREPARGRDDQSFLRSFRKM